MRNQELSEQRGVRIKTWLVAQGVNPEKIYGTVGYGTSRPMVTEPVGGSPQLLEDARIQNRRIAIRVVRTCKQ
jgi:outer membrane protein OmpA-like peptidoglycan-associated protein